MTIGRVVEYLTDYVKTSDRYINRHENIGDFFLISATLDKRNRIVSIGENNGTKSHPTMFLYSNKAQRKKKIYLHAEISALIRAPYKKARTLIVIRVNRRGNLAMAKPCPVCQLAIADAGIKDVYYSNNDGEIVYTCGSDIK